MTTPDLRASVLSLLADGRVTADVAEELLTVGGRATTEQVALLGTALRLPGADSPAGLWDALVTGRSMISTFPAERFDLVVNARAELTDEFRHLRPGLADDPRSVGGWLSGLEQFDPEGFGLAAHEAQHLGPAERLLLQLGREAFSASGMRIDEVRGTRTGIFLAYQPDRSFDYLRLFADPDERAFVSNIPANVAYRLAYTYDLHGPVVNVDTTCSSSLTALHLARRSLQLGECDLAVVGGISLDLFPYEDAVSDHFVRSPRHFCNAYDARADGIVWGEGAVVVVLQRLADARRDGRYVGAVLRGSAIGSDGGSNGMAAPNPRAHTAVVRAALADAEVPAGSVGYVEGHGAGTALGDVVEVDALSRAFAADTDRTAFCRIGSVKTVAGHLGDAAGLAGLVSAALRLRHRALPPVAGLETANPAIDWAAVPFVANTEPSVWPDPAGGLPRRAGVSSLGISGTNVHVVLEEAPARRTAGAEPGEVPVLLSADSRWSLWEHVRLLAAGVGEEISVHGVAATLGRRDVGPARLAVLAADTADLLDKLRRLLAVREFDRVPDHFAEQGILVGEDIASTAEGQLAAYPGPLSAAGRDLTARFLHGADVGADYVAAYGAGEPAADLPVVRAATRRVWPSTASAATVDVADLFFRSGWVPVPAPAATGTEHGLAVLVTADPQDALVRALIDRLRARGLRPVLAPPELTGPTGDAAHDERWWRETVGRDGPLRAVVHVTAPAPEPAMADLAALDDTQQRGVLLLFRTAQVLGRLSTEMPMVLATVAVCAQRVRPGDVFDPAAVTSFGLVRVVSQENPSITELSIDHDLAAGADRAAADVVAEVLATREEYRPQVAYRAGTRHARQIDRALAGEGREIPVRPGGVYVIAGGTGYLGPQLALHLAQRGAGTVVLLSRTGVPPREQWAALRANRSSGLGDRLAALERAEEAGARIESLRCDITDAEAVRATFAEIARRFGAVHGGFMLTKQLYHRWVGELRPDEFRSGIDNRVRGTWLLAEGLRAASADFLVLFSSISSMSGTKGAAECAAVNQFLDVAGPWLTGSGLDTYTVNLTLVLDDHADFAARSPIPPIDFTEFHAVLDRFLSDARGLDVVARLDLEEVHYLRPVLRIPFGPDIWAEAEAASAGRVRAEDAPVAATEPAGAEDVRRRLTDAWRSTLGVARPAERDNFFALGGTSLSAIRLVHMIGRMFPGSGFEVADLYAAPTFGGQLDLLTAPAPGADGPAAAEAEPDPFDIGAILDRVRSGDLAGSAAAELLAGEQQ